MDLNELKKQLYKKDGQFEGRPSLPEEFEPGRVTVEPAAQSRWDDEQEKNFYFSVRKKRIIRWALTAAVFALLAIGAWFLWHNWNSFNTGGVALDIFGQERVVSGEEVSFVARYKNNSRAEISNVVLTFYFPPQSMPADESEIVRQGDLLVSVKNLGQLAQDQEGQVEFKARVLGDKGSQQTFKAKLTYRPSGISSDFNNETEFTSTVISVPLVLSFILPERIVSGQTMNFSLRYLNTSDAFFENAKLKVDYPEGFIFDSALPAPQEGNNIWDLREIGSHEEGSIIIKGTISGSESESQVFKAQIGVQKEGKEFIAYSQTLSSPQFSASPLSVEQFLLNVSDNNVDAGQSLNYKIKYRNTTEVPIGPVFVTVKIDSQAVDLASVRTNNGFFSSSDGIITWNSSSLPSFESLGAQAEGELNFYLKVKDHLPIAGFSDKNFTIVTTAKMDSFNVPLALSGTQLAGQNQLVAKINSALVLDMKGFYSDQIIPNSGPLPPTVGQKTTYTIHWYALNSSNDVSGISVEAYLPSYARWEGNISPANEDIRYDASSGRVIWQIGELAAGTGALSSVKRVSFQVGFVPSLGQVGSAPVIVQPVKISGKDDFTGAQLSTVESALKSDMPDDSTVGYSMGIVKQ